MAHQVENFLSALEKLLPAQREKEWSRFKTVGLPKKKQEGFEYLPLDDLYAGVFAHTHKDSAARQLEILPECKEACLVFVNGIFSLSLSTVPEDVVALPLSQAKSTYGHFLNPKMSKRLEEEKDPFALLNSCFFSEGLFLYVPPKTVCASPLQILHVVDEEGSLASPRIHIVLGKEAQATLVCTEQNRANHFWKNGLVEIALEEQARLNYTSLHESGAAWEMHALRADLKKGSHLVFSHFSPGSFCRRHDYRIALLGEEARVELNGLCLLNGKRTDHTHVLIEHHAPHTTSHQHFKGVLGGLSRSSFQGKIFVKQEAQKTEAYQLNNNLLLGEHAIAYSKPNLEILADDVKASHGATVGQLDKELLFYLKTRGINTEEAHKLLLFAFCKELVQKAEIASVQNTLLTWVKSYENTR